MRTTVRNADWSVQTTSTTNPVWTHPAILSEISALVPSDAGLSGSGNLTINGTQIDLSRKIVRVISPSFPYGSSGDQALYHGWDSLLNSLISTNGSVRVASYKTDPANQNLQPYNLAGVLFGYAGGGCSTYTNQAPNMLNEQDYDYQANFTSNLNPGGNTTLTALGIGNGTAGVHLTGNLTSVGPPTCSPFDIYITKNQMNNRRASTDPTRNMWCFRPAGVSPPTKLQASKTTSPAAWSGTSWQASCLAGRTAR
jgi:hypothetical protein